MLILFHISYPLFISLKYLFFPLYLCISLMVDFHRNILGIASIGKLHRICKAFIRKCRHNKKSSLFSNEAKLVDQVKANQEIISEVIIITLLLHIMNFFFMVFFINLRFMNLFKNTCILMISLEIFQLF